MSDTEAMEKKSYEFSYNIDRSGRAGCKAKSCKEKITKGSLRITKGFDSNLGGSDSSIRMSHHYHPECFFREANVNARKHVIEKADDIEHFDTLTEEQKHEMEKLAAESVEIRHAPKKTAAKKAALAKTGTKRVKEEEEEEDEEEEEKPAPKKAKAAPKKAKAAPKKAKAAPKKPAKKRTSKKKEYDSEGESEPEPEPESESEFESDYE